MGTACAFILGEVEAIILHPPKYCRFCAVFILSEESNFATVDKLPPPLLHKATLIPSNLWCHPAGLICESKVSKTTLPHGRMSMYMYVCMCINALSCMYVSVCMYWTVCACIHLWNRLVSRRSGGPSCISCRWHASSITATVAARISIQAATVWFRVN